MPFLDEIDPLAARIGAVNTIANRLGRLSGYNTDAPGALQAIGEVMDPAGCRVLILGAGGAARAAGMALKEVGARLTIANRSAARGSRLAGDLDAQWVPLAEAGAIECDLMLQATSVGMHPQVDLSPLGPGTIRAAVVMDMIYNPRETRLLADARRQGVRIIPGWRMFMYQAALQFRLWTGAEPPMEAMAQALAEALERP